MHSFSLSWTIGFGNEAIGGNQKVKDWTQIQTCIKSITQQPSGSIMLSIINSLEIGPQSLQLFSENGHFVLMLGELNEEDYNVRTYHSRELKDSHPVVILGSEWSPAMVFTDFRVVITAFKEFHETGNVSHHLLN